MALTRKDLKHDRFVEEVGHQVAFFRRHKKTILTVAGVVIAAVLGLLIYTGQQNRRDEAAKRAFLDAVRLYHGSVTLEPRMGFVTFSTTGERIRRTTEGFETVRAEFPGSRQAAAATYYLGLLAMEQEQYEEARSLLEQALGEADRTYASLARLALADVLGRLGRTEEAKQQYDALIAKPTPVVPAERAKLELARLLAESDPASAKAVLEELMNSQSPASFAASAALRRLEGI